MKKLIVFLFFSLPGLSLWAYGNDPQGTSQCSGSYRCGSESVAGIDSRTWNQPSQPRADVDGVCGNKIPSDQTFKMRHLGVRCGEAGERNVRTPRNHPEDKYQEWANLRSSTASDARVRRQELLQYDLKWDGQVQFGMNELWTYQKIVRDADASRCGVEPWQTTCQRTQERYVPKTCQRDGRCLREAPDPEPSDSYSPGGGGTYNPPGGYRDSGPVYDGPGESVNDARDAWDSSSLNIFELLNEAKPKDLILERKTAGACLEYEKVDYDCSYWERNQTLRYNCMSTRPRICDFEVTQTGSQSCGNHIAKYEVEFSKDPDWGPDMEVNMAEAQRNYYDELPNKYDLLTGEHEEYVVYANLGRTEIMKPQMQFLEQWNDYQASIEPESFYCEFGMEPSFKVTVDTLGRRVRRAPNPLALPVDMDGNPLSPFTFSEGESMANEGEFSGKGKVVRVDLMDKARMLYIAASESSRYFERPIGSPEEDTEANYTSKVIGDTAGQINSTAFYYKSRFKVQVLREEDSGRIRQVTPPIYFNNNNHAEVFGEFLGIGLDGSGAVPDIYKGIGPFFPKLWEQAGTYIAPGLNHIIRVQVAQQSFPFYESGCSVPDLCEDDEVEESAYSEPLTLMWLADPSHDERSMFQKLNDYLNDNWL